MKSRKFRNDTGLTLIEIMLAAGFMTTALVLIMGSLISLSKQSKVAELRATSTNFTNSVLESLRGRSITDILTFNTGGTEYAVDEDGQIFMENIGYATLIVKIVVTGDSEPIIYELPVTGEKAAEIEPLLPNPIEVQVEMRIDQGFGEGNEYKFQSTSLLNY